MVSRRQWRHLATTVTTILVCCYVIRHVRVTSRSHVTRRYWAANRGFVQAMSDRASADRWLILAMVDEAFADMAINLHETSLRPHHIDNFLFVGVGRRACQLLTAAKLPCFYYTDDSQSHSPSAFQSLDFNRKMNIRTDMILDAIQANFTVLHLDIDVVFLQNPLCRLKIGTKNCDLAAMWDSTEYNAGFVIIRPTAAAIQLYTSIREITSVSASTADQTAMNRVIANMQSTGTLRVIKLNPSFYACGMVYFEARGRSFAGQIDLNCSRPGRRSCKPVVVHNNWIVSKSAKVYRFREHLLWMYDPDGSYYGGVGNKYLAYTNSRPPKRTTDGRILDPDAVSNFELAALRTALALGYLLDRIVILPAFHCRRSRRKCSLNSLLRIEKFETGFRYREHVFLRHPKVPAAVKHDVSSPVTLRMVPWSHLFGRSFVTVPYQEIADQCANRTESVLQFSSLLGWKPEFPSNASLLEFDSKIARAFVRSSYRQL